MKKFNLLYFVQNSTKVLRSRWLAGNLCWKTRVKLTEYFTPEPFGKSKISVERRRVNSILPYREEGIRNIFFCKKVLKFEILRNVKLRMIPIATSKNLLKILRHNQNIITEFIMRSHS